MSSRCYGRASVVPLGPKRSSISPLPAAAVLTSFEKYGTTRRALNRREFNRGIRKSDSIIVQRLNIRAPVPTKDSSLSQSKLKFNYTNRPAPTSFICRLRNHSGDRRIIKIYTECSETVAPSFYFRGSVDLVRSWVFFNRNIEISHFIYHFCSPLKKPITLSRQWLKMKGPS